VRTLAVRARQKNLTLSMDMPADVPLHVVGDAGRLRQVLLNLLATRSSSPTRARLTLHVRRVGAKPAGSSDAGEPGASVNATPVAPFVQLEFAVTDTGIGIPLEKQALILRRVHPGDAPHAALRGTGLGLAISSQLVGLMAANERESDRRAAFEFVVQSSCPRTRTPDDDEIASHQAHELCELIASPTRAAEARVVEPSAGLNASKMSACFSSGDADPGVR